MKKIVLSLLSVFLVASFAFASGEVESQQKTTVSKKAVDTEYSTGPNNAITDVPGIEVGNYQENNSGTTVILARDGAVGGVDVRGSAPGTRETDLLDPINLVDQVNAVVLTGGSAYGLATADGVMLWLEEHGIGWPCGAAGVVPIVPAAVLYDPGRFGREFTEHPTQEFGRKAADNLSIGPVEQGNVGAGAGAIAGGIKGGLGTASIDIGNGVIVGAIVAVNAGGSTVNPKTGELYGSYLEVGNEFGDYFLTSSDVSLIDDESEPVKNTTIACIATNVKLTKAQAKKVAEMAHDGMARAIRPSHTMFDGDTVFVLATGALSPEVLKQEAKWGYMPANVSMIGAAAADTLTRAIVHAMLSAESVGEVSNYRDLYLTE